MRKPLAFTIALGIAGSIASARGDSFPPGVTYPLHPATLQPSGLAPPLPSTRRYVLIWKDQLADAVNPISDAQKQFIVTHYVGTQKLFKHQIDEYRAMNPNFMMLVYHLAYGLNGADQPNPVGNITGPENYGQEDTDTFTPWVAMNGGDREPAYEHGVNTGNTNNRISYPDPYWLMDIASTEWRNYLFQTLIEWQAFPTAKSSGVFLDVAFFPWYDYSPDMWWAAPMLAGDGSRTALRDWWNPRATDYFNAMRAAFAPDANHPRYLVIPNPDALVDSTDEPAFFVGTDGAFTENWQAVTKDAGDWNLSVKRLCRYVTGKAKVWMADVTSAGTDLMISDREMLIGTYLLIRNGTSYYMLGNSDITWYPEYEIDLGGYVDEPPSDLEQLKVAGDGGANGGLYLRRHVSGLVLVNSSDFAQTYTMSTPMKRASFSGSGAVADDGTLPTYSLAYDNDVPAGPIQLPARSVLILRDPAGAPPPGVEPEDTAAVDGGVAPDAAMAAKSDAAAPAPDLMAAASSAGGCGCAVGGQRGSNSAVAAFVLLLLLGLRALQGRGACVTKRPDVSRLQR